MFAKLKNWWYKKDYPHLDMELRPLLMENGEINDFLYLTVKYPENLPDERVIDMYAKLLMAIETGHFHELMIKAFDDKKMGLGQAINIACGKINQQFESKARENDMVVSPSQAFNNVAS